MNCNYRDRNKDTWKNHSLYVTKVHKVISRFDSIMCSINYRDDSKGKRKYRGKRYSESFDKYMYLWYVHVTNLDTTFFLDKGT